MLITAVRFAELMRAHTGTFDTTWADTIPEGYVGVLDADGKAFEVTPDNVDAIATVALNATDYNRLAATLLMDEFARRMSSAPNADLRPLRPGHKWESES